MRKLRIGKAKNSVNLFKVKYEVKGKIKYLLDNLTSSVKDQIETHFKLPIKDIITEWVTFKWAYAPEDKSMVDAFTREVEGLMKRKLK